MGKKIGIILVMAFIGLGLGVATLNFISTEAGAEEAIFGTYTIVIPQYPDIWICIGTPRDCVIVYPQE